MIDGVSGKDQVYTRGQESWGQLRTLPTKATLKTNTQTKTKNKEQKAKLRSFQRLFQKQEV